jgi:hypothetical protein
MEEQAQLGYFIGACSSKLGYFVKLGYFIGRAAPQNNWVILSCTVVS